MYLLSINVLLFVRMAKNVAMSAEGIKKVFLVSDNLGPDYFRIELTVAKLAAASKIVIAVPRLVPLRVPRRRSWPLR